MKILSIETSCDDTGISIMQVKGGLKDASFKVLADNLSSQIKIHIPYGGVYPMLAKREHIKNLPIVLQKTLREAKLDKKKKPVDAIAVTYGPGLEMCLWAGITFAEELAKKWDCPLIPVNHMEGHLLSVFGKNNGKFKIPKVKLPMLSLLVSGGHTELVLTKKWMDYEIIGESLDDAVGEAFDKVARMLSLSYPGGPQISKLAESIRGVSQAAGPRGSAPRARGDSDPEKSAFSYSLPRPMLYSKDFNFSFSGLKTAVLYLIKKIAPKGDLNEETKRKIALEFENAAIECLVYKTVKAIEKYKIKTLIVAGGVAANQHLRGEIKKIVGPKINLFLSSKELSGDNSLMIGIAGYLRYIKRKGKFEKNQNIKAAGQLRL
jgi:N6-L-threonylcarbamoyladenine synthase